MDFLKSIFGDKALTYAELETALKDNKDIKIANLASGQYVDKSKLDGKIGELNTANETISTLQETVRKFDGVDPVKLKSDLDTLQTKYDTDTAKIRLDAALDLALVAGKAKNPKLVKAALDMEKVKLDGDKILGLDDQIEALKKSDAYLFDLETPPAGEGSDQNNQSGFRLNSGGAHGPQGNPEYDKMSDEEYYAATMKKKE